MELWIRTQNKRALIKVTNVALVSGNRVVTFGNEYKSNGYFTLGQYNEERALEILDDIEMLLCGNTMRYGLVKGVGIRSDSVKKLIYELPEE